MTPSGRRSTAISRSSHSILRKAGFVKTAAAFPLMLSLPDWPLAGPWFFASMLAPDVDRLSLFQKGSDALVEILRAAAQHLIAVFHRNHGFERAGIDTHVEAFLRQPQTDRRGRHHRIHIRCGSYIELAPFHHFRNQPDGERALGSDKTPGEDQLGGNRHTDQARQEITGADVAAP